MSSNCSCLSRILFISLGLYAFLDFGGIPPIVLGPHFLCHTPNLKLMLVWLLRMCKETHSTAVLLPHLTPSQSQPHLGCNLKSTYSSLMSLLTLTEGKITS